MDMVERVARALLNSESGGTLAWDDLCLTDRTAFKRDAKAAIRAMLEGMEPVAWRYDREGQYGRFSSSRSEDMAVGWTETPLYDLSALKEAVK